MLKTLVGKIAEKKEKYRTELEPHVSAPNTY